MAVFANFVATLARQPKKIITNVDNTVYQPSLMMTIAFVVGANP